MLEFSELLRLSRTLTHLLTYTLPQSSIHTLKSINSVTYDLHFYVFFFNFLAEEAAARAVKELNGLEVMGREMRADFAVKKDNSQNNTRQRDSNQAGEW